MGLPWEFQNQTYHTVCGIPESIPAFLQYLYTYSYRGE